MPPKNYLTKEEQRIWGHIKKKEIVDNEIIQQIFPELFENKRNKLLRGLYEKHYLRRARKNLYYNPERLKSFYDLATVCDVQPWNRDCSRDIAVTCCYNTFLNFL